MKKRLFGTLITLIMVIGLVSSLAIVASAADVASGTAGDISWTLTDDGTLTFSGTGAIPNYALTENARPAWYSYEAQIKKVVIESGITKVGTNAFNGCSALSKVILPDTLTEFRNNAFYNCANLSYVEYWGTTEPTIGSGAFGGCDNLLVVNVPTDYESDSFSRGLNVSKNLVPDEADDEGCSHENYTNGFCTLCDDYQPAELVNGVYQISNAGQLYWFMEHVNAGNTAANAILTKDIVINENVLTEDGALNGDGSNFRAWTPIGSSANQYIGTFDGNGKTVGGLYLNNSNQRRVGLFGVSNGTVKNVGVIDSYFNGFIAVGGVVGENYNTVENCYNTSIVSGISKFGGVVGNNVYSGIVKNCYNTGTVVSRIGDGEMTGGVVGFNEGTIQNCYNTGSVSGDENVGGVVGHNTIDSTVQNCYNTGFVSGNENVGGVVGWNYGSVQNCYNTGNVSSEKKVGGVVGLNDSGSSAGVFYAGSVQNCYYLSTGNLAGISVNNGTEDSVAIAKGAEKFASGEVAYLLNGDQSNIVWYQTLGANGDSLPVLTAKDNNSNTVYKNISGDYTNDVHETHTDFNNGFCTKCTDSYEPAEQNVDGYYEISNAGQLYWFAEQVNAGNRTANAILTADIVVNENVLAEMAKDTPNTTRFRTWTPISTVDFLKRIYGFEGIFDGKGYSISGLFFNNGEETRIGLFGALAPSGAVKNLTIKDSYFYAQSKVTVGAIVGQSYGTNENCHSYATLNLDTVNVAGGIVGFVTLKTSTSSAKISDCVNYGIIISDSVTSVGGVAGQLDLGVVMERCANYGDITFSYTKNATTVGGVVGGNLGAAMRYCYNVGAFVGRHTPPEGSEYSIVGGIVGSCGGNGVSENMPSPIGELTACYNFAKLPEVLYKVGPSFSMGHIAGQLGSSNTAGKEIPFTVSSCYFINDGYHAHGNGEITADDVIPEGSLEGSTAMTEAQFASGEVAYLLGSAFGQKLGADGDLYPVFATESNKVYPHSDSNGIFYYSNTVVLDNNGFHTCCVAYQPAEQNADGYYEISNAGQLYWFAQHVNAGNTNANAILTANIVVNENVLTANGALNGDGSNFRTWTPIGNYDNQYIGTFDGDGHTVSGLYFNDSGQKDVGLFGCVGTNGKIQNVGVIDSYIHGGFYAGGVVGWNCGTVTNSYNTGVVSGTEHYVGGVVGINDGGDVTNSYNTGSVSGTQGYVGGVVGNNYGDVTNSYNTGSVSGARDWVGGVVGRNFYGKVSNSSNTGVVSGSDCVGGVVGDNNGDVTNSYNMGVISGSNKVGGVVGFIDSGTVTNSYNTGVVSGNSRIGGVAGGNEGTVTNSYNMGNVSGSDYVGGVVGINNGGVAVVNNGGNVTNSYNIGSVSGVNYVGGVVGINDNSTVTNSYYLDSCGAAGEGTSVSEAQLESGEVAFRLGNAFGQKLGENGDPYPVFATESNKVYAYLHCDGKTLKYTDDASLEGKTMSHTPGVDDGDCTTDIPCTVCDQVTTKGAETHIPAADDGDCTTDIPCTVCGQVAIKGAETHIPGEDDGDCTTAVICTECGGIAIEAEHDHTLETVEQTMYCINCDVTYELVEIDFDMVESVMDAAKSVASDVLGSVVGMVGEAVSSVVDMVYDSFSRFFSNMLSGY